jgi:hypothetical protein
VAAIGAYLIIYNRGDGPVALTEEQRRKRVMHRRVGYAAISAAVAMLGYFVYTRAIVFRAEMPSDCKVCKLYTQRHRGLRPYSAGEYKLLQKHADACNTCSKMCFDEVKILREYHKSDSPALKKVQAGCVETTKSAMLARKELDRLTSNIRGNDSKFWEAATKMGQKPKWDPFPTIPKT